LDQLSSGFRFKTSVYANAKPSSEGTVIGDLTVYGRGDPSFSEAFSESDPFYRFDELARSIVGSGVKTISGSIVGDETYFNTIAIPNGWEWDDLQWYYGAEISPLSIFDNTTRLTVKPAIAGEQCVIQTSPASIFVRTINKTSTTPKGTRRKLKVTKLLGQNVIEVSGTMPENDGGFSGRIAVTKPAMLFVEVLAQRLRLQGVKIEGGIRTFDIEDRNGERFDTSSRVEIANSYSPPLSLIAAKTMKPSQNLYTELILRSLGEAKRGEDETEIRSDKLGVDAIQSVLTRAGIERGSVIQYDGSGLSRHNLITPDSAVKLFLYMDRSRNKLVWHNSLTIGGIDGTLRNRFKGTLGQANVKGKTGTLDQVSALSGYVTSVSGEKFVFSVLTNNIPNSRLRTSTIDNIVLLLANFDGTVE